MSIVLARQWNLNMGDVDVNAKEKKPPHRYEDVLRSRIEELELELVKAKEELKEYEAMLSEWGDDGGAGGNGHY